MVVFCLTLGLEVLGSVLRQGDISGECALRSLVPEMCYSENAKGVTRAGGDAREECRRESLFLSLSLKLAKILCAADDEAAPARSSSG